MQALQVNDSDKKPMQSIEVVFVEPPKRIEQSGAS